MLQYVCETLIVQQLYCYSGPMEHIILRNRYACLLLVACHYDALYSPVVHLVLQLWACPFKVM